RHAERLGFTRYWVAEHHGMDGIASAATAVVIAHVGQATSTIRIGAGGIMLPNHAPLQIAEQFGTLASLFPGRIDLGLGRAPGSDQTTARALRRTLVGDIDSFPNDVLELMNYFRPAQEGQPVIAVPGEGLDVPVWMLGSSTYGAQLAAMLGLPYAFASHFAPAELMNAIDLYRRNFRPSAQLDAPYVMAGVNIFAAETDAEARFLSSSMQQAFVNLRRGRPGKFQPPIDGYEEGLNDMERATLRQISACSFVGAKDTVREGLSAFLQRTGVDEIIVACQMFDHAARLRSYEIAAEVRKALA
ncbi:MAG: LLM class flavin-dependent oxidoreductase, partial [Phenylobacterium sp.]